MLNDTLMRELENLSRIEKLQVMQLLVSQLAQEETMMPSAVYEVWSPYDAPHAANILLEMLAEDFQKDE